MTNLVEAYASPSKRTPAVIQAYQDYRAGKLDIFGNPRGTPLAESAANPSSILNQSTPEPAPQPVTQVSSEPVSQAAPEPAPTTTNTQTGFGSSPFPKGDAINELYLSTYGRPASQEEINYHVNRFGTELDQQERSDLLSELVSNQATGADEVVNPTTQTTTSPETSASVTQGRFGKQDSIQPTESGLTADDSINKMYQDVYGRPASTEEINYYKNVYGDALDETESQDLFNRMSQNPSTAQSIFEDVLQRPASREDVADIQGLTRDQFFQRAIPELQRSSPVFQTFQQVLGRDPRLAGLDYYRNVRPDLMQDPRAFRQAAIQGGEFIPRARDLYREYMGVDPSQQRLSGLIDSGTYLNPNEFMGAIARQNVAMRPRYTDMGYNPYSSYNPYANQQYSRPFFNQFQPTFNQYQPRGGFGFQPQGMGGFFQPQFQPQGYGFQSSFRQFAPAMPAPRPGGGFSPMGGKGGGRPAPIGGKG